MSPILPQCPFDKPSIIGDLENDIDLLGLPQVPEIPKIVLCLHWPGSEGWDQHWQEFNKRVKDFHQAMIDFNWKILEWYSLKAKQLERFGVKGSYVGGIMVSGPHVTIIYTWTISDGASVTSEVKRLLPDAVKKEVSQLEKTGYRLCLYGKIFIFNKVKLIVIDYDKDSDKSFYRNCLKFTLYDKNEKINIFDSYSRVYGSLRSSFILGGIGGLLVSLVTGYFDRHPLYARACPDQNLMWLMGKRWAFSSISYTFLERVLLLKFSQPPRYIVSGTAGAICGLAFAVCDNCGPYTMLGAAVEFGVYSLLCSLILKKHLTKICCAEC